MSLYSALLIDPGTFSRSRANRSGSVTSLVNSSQYTSNLESHRRPGDFRTPCRGTSTEIVTQPLRNVVSIVETHGRARGCNYATSRGVRRKPGLRDVIFGIFCGLRLLIALYSSARYTESLTQRLKDAVPITEVDGPPRGTKASKHRFPGESTELEAANSSGFVQRLVRHCRTTSCRGRL